ncbi:MAG: LuxR C-terminal-related transcriptional regulator [Lacibacter sp.]
MDQQLYSSKETVKTHRGRMMQKINISSCHSSHI